jgi:hypothetical protein
MWKALRIASFQNCSAIRFAGEVRYVYRTQHRHTYIQLATARSLRQEIKDVEKEIKLEVPSTPINKRPRSISAELSLRKWPGTVTRSLKKALEARNNVADDGVANTALEDDDNNDGDDDEAELPLIEALLEGSEDYEA